MTALPAALLLALPAAGLWLWLIDERGRFRLGAREAVAWTAVIWAAATSLLVELLSLGAGHDVTAERRGHLTLGWLLLFWTPAAIAGAVILWRRRGLVRREWTRVRGGWRGSCRLEKFLIGFALGCVVAVGLVAFVAAPNTWDSMTYHLARVAAWLRLGGVAHYATSAEPQLFQPPGAELLILQWQALVGGDRMAAIVQWTAYAISIGVVSWIAARLGATRRGQLLAAFLTATAPMALLEGSSTQNDLVVGVWLLIAGALALAIWQDDRLPWPRVLLACTAVGLAVLTKGTAWLFVPPLAVLLAAVTVRRLGWPRAAAAGIAGLLLILALNAGQWQRNHSTYGRYVYAGSGATNPAFDYSTDTLGPATLVSNLVRNSAIYFGTPAEGINRHTTDAVRGALEAAGIDPDDAAATFYGHAFAVPKSGPDENHGPSPLLFLLTAWALALVLFARGFRTTERAAWAGVVVVQVLIFSLLVKWQPWHARLHLPVVLAGVPLVAVVLEQIKRRWFTTAVIVVAAAAAPLYIALNVNRPLFGEDSIVTTSRDSQYFTPRPELESRYRAAIARARAESRAEVAISGNFDDWYYPFDVLGGDYPAMSETLIGNPSGKYAAGKPLPDVIICLHCEGDRQATMTKAGLRLRSRALDAAGYSVEYWSR